MALPKYIELLIVNFSSECNNLFCICMYIFIIYIAIIWWHNIAIAAMPYLLLHRASNLMLMNALSKDFCPTVFVFLIVILNYGKWRITWILNSNERRSKLSLEIVLAFWPLQYLSFYVVPNPDMPQNIPNINIQWNLPIENLSVVAL